MCVVIKSLYKHLKKSRAGEGGKETRGVEVELKVFPLIYRRRDPKFSQPTRTRDQEVNIDFK